MGLHLAGSDALRPGRCTLRRRRHSIPPACPLRHDVIHQRLAGDHQVGGGRAEAARVGLQRLGRRLAGVRPVEVGRGAQHGDTLQVEQARFRAPLQRLVGRVVFLRRHAVGALVVRHQLVPGTSALAQQVAMKPGIAGHGIALRYLGRLVARRHSVERAISLCGRRVGQADIGRQRQRLLQQRFIKLEHFRAIVERRFLAGRLGVDAEVAGIPSGRPFACIDFPRQVPVHQVTRPGGSAGGSLLGVDAGNAGNQEVGLAEIELAAVDQGRDRCRRIGLAHVSGDLADIVGIAMHLRVGRRQARHRDGLGQRQLVQPRLGLGYEHADDHDLDRPRRGSLRDHAVGMPAAVAAAASRFRERADDVLLLDFVVMGLDGSVE
jgi:hypothetical protein